MRASKQRLSILKNRVNEVIPDSENVFGFEGISKGMIIQVIDETYSIVSLLDQFESDFEAILFERKTSEYYESAAKLLKENLETEKDAFNDFLNLLGKMHFRAKEAYIAVANEPIRAEANIKKAKEELLELQTTLNEIKPIHEEILKIQAESKNFISELDAKHTSALEKEELITENFNEINIQRTEVEKSAKQIPNWEENIKNLKEEISSKSVIYEELKTKIELLKGENEINTEKNKKLLDEFEKQLTDNAVFQEQIQKTIEDANRHGMAGSFKKRKDELRWALILCGALTLGSIITLIVLSYNILFEISLKDLEAVKLLARIPIFASCVWLGWFCAKQYGFTTRVMEDYSYKYAVSMAFEGYKKATRDIDEGLQLKLLEMTIYNISNNPLNIYETTNNDGTPYHEFLKNLPKLLSFRTKKGIIETETTIKNSN
jgi:hypothetical protein